MLALAGQERRNVATCARMLAGLPGIHGADAPGRAIAAALERGSCHPETAPAIADGHRREQGLPAVTATGSHGATPRGTGLEAYDRPETAGKDRT